MTAANIREPLRQKEVSFLIDTGATRAWISEQDFRIIVDLERHEITGCQAMRAKAVGDR